MNSSWTRGLEPDYAREIKGDFKSSLILRKRMKAILEEKLREIENTSLHKNNYDTPNWAMLQADIIGQKRSIKYVIDLISDSE